MTKEQYLRARIGDIEELAPDAKIIKVASIYCEDIPDAREEIADALERATEVTA